MFACMYGHTDMVEVLISAGATTDIRDKVTLGWMGVGGKCYM